MLDGLEREMKRARNEANWKAHFDKLVEETSRRRDAPYRFNRADAYEEALQIKDRYGIQFFDSLLLAAASDSGCNEILTEDLADGQTYCGVKAVNPFK